jgi:hypothetical protein
MAPTKTKKAVLAAKKSCNPRAKRPTRSSASIDNPHGETGLNRDIGEPGIVDSGIDQIAAGGTETTRGLEVEVSAIRGQHRRTFQREITSLITFAISKLLWRMNAFGMLNCKSVLTKWQTTAGKMHLSLGHAVLLERLSASRRLWA